MSSILDALKKSEADRQRAAGPTLLEMRVQPRRRGLPAWAIALGVLLLGNAVLLAWLTMRHAPDVSAAAPPPAALPAAPPVSPPAPAFPAAADAAPAALPAAIGRGTRVPQPVAAEADDNPADEAPAVEPAPRHRRAAATQDSPPSYGALKQALPPLHLDLHFWSDAPAERYALINLHRVGEGDTLPEGPRVLEITREGVVMEYEGREFVLGRE